MTKEMWKEIELTSKDGDPLKDVTDEEELLAYCFALRKAIAKVLPTVENEASLKILRKVLL